jgi:hypothetical protein
MAHEVRGLVQGGTDSRVEEFRDPEPAGEDQPAVGGRFTGGAPPGMTYEEVEERSRLGRFIPMSSLPGSPAELIEGAQHLNAPDDILDRLGSLPDGRYETVNQIWAALGGHNEERRT